MLASIAHQRRAWFTVLLGAVPIRNLSPGADGARGRKLAGKVTDPDGEPVPFAMVTATSVDTGQVLPAATGADGTYKFRLPSGTYRVTYRIQGTNPLNSLSQPSAGPGRSSRIVSSRWGLSKPKVIPPPSLLSSHRQPLPPIPRSRRSKTWASLPLRPRAMLRPRRSSTNVPTC